MVRVYLGPWEQRFVPYPRAFPPWHWRRRYVKNGELMERVITPYNGAWLSLDYEPKSDPWITRKEYIERYGTFAIVGT